VRRAVDINPVVAPFEEGVADLRESAIEREVPADATDAFA
jgi:hypothetical protein